MKNSVISHPEDEPLIIVRQWQLEFCLMNACAAALLSFFEYWHKIKLEGSRKFRKYNDIAEMHGDPRNQDETLLQWHTEKELEQGVLIYKRDAINKAIDFLVGKKAITVTRNPNPRYKFDKTRYFSFHPEVLIKWLKEREDRRSSENPSSTSENQGQSQENPSRQTENQARSAINQAAISETSSEITIETTNRVKEIDTSPSLSVSSSTHNLNSFSISEEKETSKVETPITKQSPNPNPNPTENQSDNLSKHPAIVAVRGILGKFPNKLLWEEIIVTLGKEPDLDKLRLCAKEWAKKTSNMWNLTWLFEWYAKGIPLSVYAANQINQQAQTNQSQPEKVIRGKAAFDIAAKRFLEMKAAQRREKELKEQQNGERL
jgi:hypothetical protein